MAGVDLSKYAHSTVHKAVLTRDYPALKRMLAGLPRLANPSEIRTEAASIAEEEKADTIATAIDRRDVPNRETPLHLAVKLADPIAAEMLMVAGADWSLQNEQGWSALQEAICSRDETITRIIVRHYQPLAWAKWCRRLPHVVATMRRMRDFYMEITFHFESSVIPFISRIAPSDTYKIWKRGSNLRADMTLAGFDGFRIQRADQSILFLGDGSEDGKVPSGSLCMISHKDKEIMNTLDGAGSPATEIEIDQEVAAMFKTNVFRPGIDVTQAVVLPQLTWRRQEKTEMVGLWKAKVYDMHHVEVSVKSRPVPGAMTDDELFSSCNENDTESETYEDVLTEEEKKQLEAALNMDPSEVVEDGIVNGVSSQTQSSYEEREIPIEDASGCSNNEVKQDKKGWFGSWGRRGNNNKLEGQKKTAPPRSSLSVDSKVSNLLGESPSRAPSKPGRHSIDGVVRSEDSRKGKEKLPKKPESARRKDSGRESEYKKGLRPILWLSPNFPLKTEELLPLLDILANKVKAIRRLRELLTTKLPAGTFPVKVIMDSEPTHVEEHVLFTPPGSTDPGWKYAYLMEKTDPNSVTCRLCGKVLKGGINRMKQHLGHIKGNCKACPKANDEVQKEIRDYIEGIVKKKNEKAVTLKEMREEVAIRATGSSTTPCDGTCLGKRPRSSDDDIASMPMRQSVIKETLAKEERARVNKYVAKFFYDCDIPFNVATKSSFIRMCEAIGQYGSGYKSPSYYEIAEPLLKDEVEETKEFLKSHKDAWKKSGCSIMTDAWTDMRGRSIMNLCVNSSLGTCFLKSVDASADAHTVEYISALVEDCIKEVGVDNVLQVVTDNASANMAAGRLLKTKYPKIFWSSCTAHCLDLILEEFGKEPKVKNCIAKARTLTIFIYSHAKTLSLMRHFTQKGEIVGPGQTRFATCFLTLQSVFEKKEKLRLMFSSDEWRQCKWSKTRKGEVVGSIVLSTSFWSQVSLTLKVFSPLVRLLRIVDGDRRPSLSFVYGGLEDAKKEIKSLFKDNEHSYKPYIDAIDSKSKGRLDSSLHLAAYYLNPYYFYKDDKAISEDSFVIGGFLYCLEIFYPDLDVQDVITTKEMVLYKNGDGPFGKPLAIKQRSVEDAFDPANWWSLYGGETPYMKAMALKILKLTSSSSGCERNWSSFAAVAIPVIPTIRVLVTFTKFEELQPVEEFATPPSSPEKTSPDSPPSSSWLQWMKAPYRQNNSSISGSSSRVEDRQDIFLIPSDYTWVTPEEKRKMMQERKNNLKKGRPQNP